METWIGSEHFVLYIRTSFAACPHNWHSNIFAIDFFLFKLQVHHAERHDQFQYDPSGFASALDLHHPLGLQIWADCDSGSTRKATVPWPSRTVALGRGGIGGVAVGFGVLPAHFQVHVVASGLAIALSVLQNVWKESFGGFT